MHPQLADEPALAEELADQHYRRGDIPAAVAEKRRALALYVAAADVEGQARCQQAIGHLCNESRDFGAAARAFRDAIALRAGLPDRRTTAVCWNRLAEVHQQTGDHAAALRAFEEAFAWARASGALRDLGTMLNNAAVSHRELGQIAQAFACHARALEIRRSTGDDEGLGATLHNLGALQADTGDLDSARRTLTEARCIREELGDLSALACTLLRIGIVHEQSGELDVAGSLYGEAIALCRRSACSVETLAAALCNLGGLLIARHEVEHALELLAEARALLAADVDTPALAQVLYYIGLAHVVRQRLPEGRQALQAAERIQRDQGDKRTLSATMAALGGVAVAERDFDAAEKLLLAAIDIQRGFEEGDAEVHTLRLLAWCKRQQGESVAAERYAAQADRNLAILRAPRPVIDMPAEMVPGTLQ